MKTAFLIFLLLFNYQLADDEDENIRYILIEAQCKPGFNALPGIENKVILTRVWKEEFENAFEMVNAEPELIKAFEVALEKAYPNQRNNINDILVYMLNTEKEAIELYKRKLALFKTMETGIIELKLK